jgi:hypothetical protein
MLKRLAVSRTNLLHSLLVNLGYSWSLRPETLSIAW